MDMIGYVVWNPEKETYLTVRNEWARRVQHAAIFEKHANAMRAIKDTGIGGLRVLENSSASTPSPIRFLMAATNG